MKGDFTRDTFDPAKHFSRVLMQQGRVTLDADARNALYRKLGEILTRKVELALEPAQKRALLFVELIIARIGR